MVENEKYLALWDCGIKTEFSQFKLELRSRLRLMPDHFKTKLIRIVYALFFENSFMISTKLPRVLLAGVEYHTYPSLSVAPCVRGKHIASAISLL